MHHLKAAGAAAATTFPHHLSQRNKMTSPVTYTRKRRTPTGAVKSEFDEFRHVQLVSKTPKPKKEQVKVKVEKENKQVNVENEQVKVENKQVKVEKEQVKTEDVKIEEGLGCEVLLKAMDEMVVDLTPLTFKAPVAFVYNPLEYARKSHEEYVHKYGGKKVDVLLVGMNPGPFGMVQTGVPFGDSVFVREFLHITTEVEPPEEMHPKRPIIGLQCPRREVSGQRVWGWAQARFGTATAFFDRFWIHNYCPLMFMEPSGKNRTPDKLTIAERASIMSICNKALRTVIDVTNPRLIVGIGKYAVERIKQCAPPGAQVGYIMHPSPANPKANKDWDKLIEAQLRALGVEI